jgi:hypothetical protein
MLGTTVAAMVTRVLFFIHSLVSTRYTRILGTSLAALGRPLYLILHNWGVGDGLFILHE